MRSVNIDRRRVLAGSAALAGIAAIGALRADPALAAAPKAGAQMPGVHRFAVGDIEVTAVLDGHLDVPTKIFPKADAAGLEMLQKQAFQPVGDTVRLPVNLYVVNTGDQMVLVDSGTGQLMGPNLGKLGANLKVAGIDPAAVDVILATHLHPDHIGGLFSQGGVAMFPNAELVAHEADIAFWTSHEIMAKAPDEVKPFFQAAQSALKVYDGRLRPIAKDGAVAKGIAAMQLPGHTPGHTGFIVSSGNAAMLIWGDVVHAAALQFAKPEWAIAFDVDQDVAIATRRKAFDMAANDRLRIAGMHLPFPGVGHVAKAADGYAFVPMDWQYTL
jgi:glyoxylase-like metal-dependent hydrolase (beta-lactamase superfamily II)